MGLSPRKISSIFFFILINAKGMVVNMHNETAKNIRESLTADCSQCFGLCCTALNLIASSDFPINKPAGSPCVNLQSDYGCKFTVIYGRKVLRAVLCLTVWVLDKLFPKLRLKVKAGGIALKLEPECSKRFQLWSRFTK